MRTHHRFPASRHGAYALRVDDERALAGRLVLALRSFQLVEDARRD